jgi:hypothetical protein
MSRLLSYVGFRIIEEQLGISKIFYHVFSYSTPHASLRIHPGGRDPAMTAFSME